MKNVKKLLKKVLPKIFWHVLVYIWTLFYKFKLLLFNFIVSLNIDILHSYTFKIFLRLFNLEVRSFISLKENLKLHSTFITELNKRNICYSFSAPAFWPDKQLNNEESLKFSGKYELSDLLINSVQILGNSNLILLDGDKAVYDLKFHDKDSRYSYTDGGIKAYKNSNLLVKYSPSIRTIEKGVKLTANFSWNYFHLIFEVLSKFYYLQANVAYKDIPLLIDKIVLEVPQYNELLKILNDDNREIIAIENGERCVVKELYLLPEAVICAPNYLKNSKVLPEDSVFDLETLGFLREKLLKCKIEKSFPKRIFLSRNNASNRRKYNEDEVFAKMENIGFIKVSPEEYSIPEQVTMFNGAEFIVGTSGAAFSNLLFCEPKCKVLCFTNFNLPFSFFSTIADYVGLEMTYFNDVAKKVDQMGSIHDSFFVDLQRVDDFLIHWNLKQYV